MMLYQKPKPQRPSGHISDPLLFQLSEWVSAHMGLYFPSERRRDLERGIVLRITFHAWHSGVQIRITRAPSGPWSDLLDML